MARKRRPMDDDDLSLGVFRPILTNEMQTLKKEMRHAVLRSELSEDQETVFQSIMEWNEDKQQGQVLTLGGYAGSGKSTLVSVFASLFEDRPFAYCALTGKAANVLKQKLTAANINPISSHVGTIHSLLYRPITDKHTGRIVGWQKRVREDTDYVPYDLIVVDEASMVSQEVFDDLAAWTVPILAIGDHGQLPPVNSDFNLMENPELRLEKIHRQAAGSPILALSAYVREEGALPLEFPTQDVLRLEAGYLRSVLGEMYGRAYERKELKDVAVLCYTNSRRRGINAVVRQLLFPGTTEPQVGDQVICLKNAGRIFNGMRAEITKIRRNQHWYEVGLAFKDDGFHWEGLISAYQFGREVIKSFEDLHDKRFYPNSWKELGLLFDYGYALTVHKAQGSGFKHVVLSYERPKLVDYDGFRRWLYSAVTRATETLTIVG